MELELEIESTLEKFEREEGYIEYVREDGYREKDLKKLKEDIMWKIQHFFLSHTK